MSLENDYKCNKTLSNTVEPLKLQKDLQKCNKTFKIPIERLKNAKRVPKRK